MNRGLTSLKEILTNLVNIYEKAVNLLDKERGYLVKINSDGLIKVIQEKRKLAEDVEREENKLKEILTKNGVENISELLFFLSETYDVDEIRVLNGKLRTLLEDFRIKSDVNRMIAKEHAEFFNGLICVYASLLANSNYDRNANANIDAQTVSLRA